MKVPGYRAALLVVLLLGLVSCTGDDDGDDKLTQNGVGTGAVTPWSIVEDYRAMADAVTASMDHEQYFHDGTWHQHFGDGLMFGPSFDLAEATLTGSVPHYLRALEVLDTNAAMVRSAAGSPGGLMDAFSDLESVAMALMGLLEADRFMPAAHYVDASAGLAGLVDVLSRVFGDYLPPGLGEFAGATYGPTAITSLIALLDLGLARALGDADGYRYLLRARDVLEGIHRTAWSADLGVYRFAPDDDRLMLYPNATLMMAYGRAYEATGEPVYADRMAAIYDGIQPLRAAAGDHYHSPYSRDEAGAVGPDYATLSSQNYLMIGLWFAYAATGDQRYLDDIDRILGWIETHLFVDGVIKHHWVNGRTADERDLYDFCSGCNLQTLYILNTIECAARGLPH